jgi:uncharacterized protein
LTPAPLSPRELSLICGVFERHPEVASVKVFGSRAKGTHTPRSDVDLAVWGDVDALRAETISAELDELPLPYRFDVKPFDSIQLPDFREHVERVGILIYPKAGF